MRETPDPRVLAWARPRRDLHITAITAAELLHGVARLDQGKKRDRLSRALDELLLIDFRARVLELDVTAGAYYAEITTARARHGRPIGLADALIAATALAAGAAAIATRDRADFDATGLPLINPWD